MRRDLAGLPSATLASWSLMAPSRTMAAMTSAARSAAPSGLRLGASREGACTRPPSMAASATVTARADLPKYFCAAASTP